MADAQTSIYIHVSRAHGNEQAPRDMDAVSNASFATGPSVLSEAQSRQRKNNGIGNTMRALHEYFNKKVGFNENEKARMLDMAHFVGVCAIKCGFSKAEVQEILNHLVVEEIKSMKPSRVPMYMGGLMNGTEAVPIALQTMNAISEGEDREPIPTGGGPTELEKRLEAELEKRDAQQQKISDEVKTLKIELAETNRQLADAKSELMATMQQKEDLVSRVEMLKFKLNNGM